MALSPLITPAQSLPLSPQVAQRLALIPGTLINAKVVSLDGNQATLQINQQTLTARTTLPLQVGQSYTFKVQVQNGQWQLQLQPVTQETAASNRLLSPAPQLPPQHALAQLSSLLSNAQTTAAASLAPLITQMGKALIKEIRQLTDKTLPEKLKNSGVLLENRLAKGAVPTQDMKAVLLQLLRQMPKENKTEIRALSALLRHIEQHQLNNLNNDWFGFPLWFAPQSPIAHAQVWFRPPQPQWQATEPWQALLQLDLKHSGLLEALITWSPDSPLSLRLWTPNPQLQQRLEAELETLQAQLGNASIHFSPQPLANRVQPARTIKTYV